MFEPTGSQSDAASTIFNLSDYRVIDAFEVPGRSRRVEVESTSPPGCPACGLFAVRGERSYWVGVHAALVAALRSRIRAL